MIILFTTSTTASIFLQTVYWNVPEAMLEKTSLLHVQIHTGSLPGPKPEKKLDMPEEFPEKADLKIAGIHPLQYEKIMSPDEI